MNLDTHKQLAHALQKIFKAHHLDEAITQQVASHGEITLEIAPPNLHSVCLLLRDEASLKFNMLMDVCGVDYLHYGIDEWKGKASTATGFSRAVKPLSVVDTFDSFPQKARFAVVYHLLSLDYAWRLRLRVFVDASSLTVPSVVALWPAANWFEREVFDLFGIMFDGHPDLRRILTDYGFKGHPFRKDFPLIGHIEMRYDETLNRCVYEPVSIKERVLVPKVIARDQRYKQQINVKNKDNRQA